MLSANCDGPNVMLLIHITSFTKNDEKCDLCYIYVLTPPYCGAPLRVARDNICIKSVTFGPSQLIH